MRFLRILVGAGIGLLVGAGITLGLAAVAVNFLLPLIGAGDEMSRGISGTLIVLGGGVLLVPGTALLGGICAAKGRSAWEAFKRSFGTKTVLVWLCRVIIGSSGFGVLFYIFFVGLPDLPRPALEAANLDHTLVDLLLRIDFILGLVLASLFGFVFIFVPRKILMVLMVTTCAYLIIRTLEQHLYVFHWTTVTTLICEFIFLMAVLALYKLKNP